MELMRKKLISMGFVSMCLVLSGCGEAPQQKTDFLIQIYPISHSGQYVSISKPGKILGTEELTVTSQVSGRIKKKNKKDGETVAPGEYILSIDDSIGNYGLQVARARTALSRAVLQYNQTKVSVEKSSSDTSNALEAAQNAYNSSQEGLLLQLDVQKKSLLSSLDAILHQVDTYLAVSSQYNIERSYDIYLGAKNSAQKSTTEAALLKLYGLRDQVKSIASDSPTFAIVSKAVVVMESAYAQARSVLDETNQVFVNTISSAELPQSVLDGYKATIDGLKAGLQGSYAAFTAYHTQVKTQNIANQENRLTNDIGVKNAQSTYDSFVQSKDLQVGMSRNAIADAQIGYQDALSRFDKLGVKSPITGVIGTILVDEGQEVSLGTPLFTLAGNQEQMVEVFVTADELSFLHNDQPAYIAYDGKMFSGKVVSLSSVAEKTTLYRVIVSLEDTVDMFGDVAVVILPIAVNTPVLPINAIIPLAANSGYVWVFDGTGIQRQDVHMGRVWNDSVQIDSFLPDGLQVIINDVGTYDSEKFILKKQ